MRGFKMMLAGCGALGHHVLCHQNDGIIHIFHPSLQTIPIVQVASVEDNGGRLSTVQGHYLSNFGTEDKANSILATIPLRVRGRVRRHLIKRFAYLRDILKSDFYLYRPVTGLNDTYGRKEWL